jgi:NADH-quinone oxidoreductase subunit J
MEAIVFFVAAAIVLAGALGVVLSRNPVHSALSLVIAMIAIAVLFLMQDADLVAIVQIVVYASAIVVLFLFVIMLLGVDRDETLREPLPLQRPLALGVGALVLVEVLLIGGREWVTGTVRAADDARALASPGTGNVQRLAEVLFTDFFWPFQVTAVLLVIAVVGGVVLARRSRLPAPSHESHLPGPEAADTTAGGAS